MRSLKEYSEVNKTVLVRGDLDVEVEKDHVVEDFRLRMMLPTLKYLLKMNAKIVVCGHLGRPEGYDITYTLSPIVKWFSEFLGIAVGFSENWYTNPQEVRSLLTKDRVVVLQNLRFYAEEEENRAPFVRLLASFADVYVNEAFSASHRDHASIVGVPRLLPAYAGLRLSEEVKELKAIRENPARPLVMIMGGGKADTKVPIVSGMSTYADTILLGGKLMFAKELEGIKGVRFPVDAIGIEDIGPKSAELFETYIDKAATIVWNGPMGVYEKEEFSHGTRRIAEAVLNSGARTVIGGGDTIAAMNAFGLLKKFDFVSTGGGAMLEYLGEGTLPGLEALS